MTEGRSFWRPAGNPAERPGQPDQLRLWAQRDAHQLKGHLGRTCDRRVWRRQEREPHQSKCQQSVPPLCPEAQSVSKHPSAFCPLARRLPIDKPDTPSPCPSLYFSPPPRDNLHSSVSTESNRSIGVWMLSRGKDRLPAVRREEKQWLRTGVWSQKELVTLQAAPRQVPNSVSQWSRRPQG